jgi:hypothetical protein
MTRSILAGLAAVVSLVVVSGTGCSQTGVGDPCVPEQEYNPGFVGFNVNEVDVESKSFQCQTRLCLVNHFQGRVSCPYGQLADGTPVAGNVGSCVTPATQQCVDGKACADGSQPPAANAPCSDGSMRAFVDSSATGKATVKPVCTNRTASQAVYCSCRCANANGKTDDGANYCNCPDGFDCEQLVSSIGAGDSGLTGGYCIKHGTKFDPSNPCMDTCAPGAPANGCGDPATAQPKPASACPPVM